MQTPSVLRRELLAAGLISLAVPGLHAQSAPALDAAILPLATQEAPLVLDTLKKLTSFDSGTGQAVGMDGVASTIEAMSKELGGVTERLTPANGIVGPNLKITFKGTGKKKLLLIAHMDTVYPAGTAATRPFRIDGNKAIAPGIADDKGGIAVFLHVMKILKARGYTDYAQITMLFNSDEERGSIGSRDTIRRLASEHDAVLSGEGTGDQEVIVMGTAGAGRTQVKVAATRLTLADRPIEEMADVILRTKDTPSQVQNTRMNWTIARAETPDLMDKLPAADLQFASLEFQITGKASHAGVNPHLGVNAVVEMAHLVARVSALLDAQAGTEAQGADSKILRQWRRAGGGLVGNIIPDRANAALEIAAPKSLDLKVLEAKLIATATQAQVQGALITATATAGRTIKTDGLPDATATADVRVADMPTFEQLSKHTRALFDKKKFSSSRLDVQDGIGFPPFVPNEQGKQMAQLAKTIYTQLGGQLDFIPRTYGATDAAWAAQSGKPVIENMGLPGGNYHSDQEEYILIDRIPRRLAMVAEMIRLVGN
ncbi:M20/M25/M40 family metallo-hydrolase [Variovorax sp. PCZ-1]|uniref:M20/M25/M40 family metallo-hydrolase n=1 Tax=Variovorax sp. PCZ-1 TaxID=2835533 RepID=UPI001BCD99C7|nr:M20/M25/M40 family metallo-hydrolase [Variovorax sp. PCZ-1]MBS7806997.1 M20/M25/M40 family metallo-hydrolase [Variovorax sp. PCZ-1]